MLKNNTKRILSIVFAICLVFSCAFTISASAVSYSTGTYSVTPSNGINVRSGAGTGYSIVGAASPGINFYVSQVSGSWGYTDSISCTNGTRSGWVSLDYCSKQGETSNSSTSSTGTYSVTPSSGINVRSGAGTSYSIVGAASQGISFYVSQTSGFWGYTDSIYCTNGTKSG